MIRPTTNVGVLRVSEDTILWETIDSEGLLTRFMRAPTLYGEMGDCMEVGRVCEVVGYTFKRVGRIEPERDQTAEIREFLPQSQYRNVRGLSLNSHGAGPFFCFQIARGMHEAGVYVITAGEEPVYVGKCQDLAERFGPRGYGAIQPKNCFVGGQPTNCKVNNLILRCANKSRRGQVLNWYIFWLK